jgi:hypothetical protein
MRIERCLKARHDHTEESCRSVQSYIREDRYLALQITIQIELSTSPLSKHSPTPARPLDRSMPAAPSEAFLAPDPANVQPLPSSTLGRKFCSLPG